jgi:hypothetical protein
MPHDAVAGVLAAPGFTRVSNETLNGFSLFYPGEKNMKKPWTLAGNMRNKSRSLDGGFVGRWI